MDRKFMMQAIRLAARKSADGSHGPFGAVIVRRGKVVASGWNTVVANHDPTAHAEIMAIRRACRKLRTHRLTGCSIYTSCEPCPMCLAAIYWAGIRSVFYAGRASDAARAGFSDAEIYRQIRLPHGRRSVVMTRIGRRAAWAVLRKWASNPNRKPY